MVPDAVTILAGFVMAHAVWSQSDLPEGEAFIPVAVVEQSGQRKMMRFNAESAELAIENGRTALLQQPAWAFAYATDEKSPSGHLHFINVEALSSEMKKPVVFRYQYQRTLDGRFNLIGPPRLVSDEPRADAERSAVTRTFVRGIGTHPKAAPLWSQWESK